MSAKKSKIGELLLQAGVITEEQLQEALNDQKTYGGRLATILVEKCHISEEQYLEALRSHLKIPAVNLTGLVIPEQTLKSFPYDIAVKYNVLVYGERKDEKGEILRVAMSDPTDLEALDELAARTGLRFEPALAMESAIRFILNDFFIIQNARGDYVLKEEDVPKFCGPEAEATYVYELEKSRVMEAYSPDPFLKASQFLEREGGAEWAKQVGGVGGDRRRPDPPPPQHTANGREVKALVDLLVAKGVITEGEYLKALTAKS